MPTYDVVLRGGRVIDPESGLDAVRDVAIAGDRVAAVGTGLPPGRQEADVAGQVVTAGFVDLHSHAHDLGSARLQVADGVTTALELEAGATPGGGRLRGRGRGGPSAELRVRRLLDDGQDGVLAGVTPDGSVESLFANLADPRWQRAASPTEIGRVLGILEADVADGALGIGLLLGYAPGTTPEEYVRVAALASAGGVPTFTHARDLIEFTPDGPVDGAEEIVRTAGETGARMHYCHVNSTTLRHADRVLGLVERAQRAGAQVSTEAYPYGAGMTGIGAAFLAPDRLADRGLTPASIIYAPTGEEVSSAARLNELRAADPGGLAIIRQLDDDDPADQAVLLRYLTFPGSVIASDAMPLTWIGAVPSRMRGRCRPQRSLTRGRPAPTPARSARSAGTAAECRCRRSWPSAACIRRCCCRTGCRRCGARVGSARAATPTSWCSTRKISPTRPPTPTAPGRPLASGTCSSTAPSWSATADWTPTPGRVAPSAPEPRLASGG